MTEKLLLVREQLVRLYGRYSMVIQPLTRFLVMFGALYVMSLNIGFGKYNHPLILVGASLIGIWLPVGLEILLAALLSLLNLYSLSLEVMLTMAGLMVIMFCVNYVFRPEMNLLILLLPICHYLKIPYAAVLVVGLTGSLLELVPVTFATVIYYGFTYIGKNANAFSSAGSLEAVQKYTQLISGLMANREMQAMCAALCVMLVVTWVIGRLKADYSKQIALAGGLVAGMLLQLISIFVMDIRYPVVSLVVGFAVSGLIAYAIQFMLLPLNYLQTENVQFEDDDYYYYVKAVPKMAISRPNVQVKKLNIRKELENTSAIPDISSADLTEELPESEDR